MDIKKYKILLISIVLLILFVVILSILITKSINHDINVGIAGISIFLSFMVACASVIGVFVGVTKIRFPEQIRNM